MIVQHCLEAKPSLTHLQRSELEGERWSGLADEFLAHFLPTRSKGLWARVKKVALVLLFSNTHTYTARSLMLIFSLRMSLFGTSLSSTSGACALSTARWNYTNCMNGNMRNGSEQSDSESEGRGRGLTRKYLDW